ADFLLPIAVKLNNQRHLAAIRDSFIIAMPLVMVASVFVLLNSLAVNFFHTDMFSEIATVVDRGTLGILAVLVSFTTAYNLSKHIITAKPDLRSSGFTGIHAGGLSVAVMFMMMPIVSNTSTVNGELVDVVNVYAKTLMSSGGLFYSIIGALLSTELFAFFSGIKKLQIKMPEEVPPA